MTKIIQIPMHFQLEWNKFPFWHPPLRSCPTFQRRRPQTPMPRTAWTLYGFGVLWRDASVRGIASSSSPPRRSMISAVCTRPTVHVAHYVHKQGSTAGPRSDRSWCKVSTAMVHSRPHMCVGGFVALLGISEHTLYNGIRLGTDGRRSFGQWSRPPKEHSTIKCVPPLFRQ